MQWWHKEVWAILNRPLWEVELWEDVWVVCSKPSAAIEQPSKYGEWQPAHSPSTLPGNPEANALVWVWALQLEKMLTLSHVAEWVHHKSGHWGPKSTWEMRFHFSVKYSVYKLLTRTAPSAIDLMPHPGVYWVDYKLCFSLADLLHKPFASIGRAQICTDLCGHLHRTCTSLSL